VSCRFVIASAATKPPGFVKHAHHALALLVVVATGCDHEVVPLSDYTLTIEPRVPLNQSPFDDDATITVVLRDALGGATYDTIDRGGQSAQGGAFGPLDGETLGVLVQTAGTENAFDRDAAIAYGETGPFTLTTGSDDARLLVAQVGGIGNLGVFDNDHAGLHAALAMTPDGVTWMFGGSHALTGTGASAHTWVQQLDELDDGSWTFDVVGEMPDQVPDGHHDAVVGATATTVDVDGQPLVFVAGGRPLVDPPNDNTKAVSLFDPATEEFVWTAGQMIGSRSEHLAVRLDGGGVLLIGGVAGTSGFVGVATWEIFNPSTRAFQPASGTITSSAVGLAAAAMGGDGALVCGGALVDRAGEVDTTHPQDDCFVISPTGAATRAHALPTGLQFLAMATLPDGKILACGGADADADEGVGAAATTLAYVYDPVRDAWAPTGSMNLPRMRHRTQALPDGRVLILGGADAGGYLPGATGEPVDCAEIYAPVEGTFELAEPCGEAGSGADPLVAGDGVHEPIVVSGYDAAGSGGYAYGVIGTVPHLP
jgi:hypothetical protein